MDLLFSKYASPYFLLDEMINLGRLSEFVYSVAEIENEKKLWEIYLALVSNPYSEIGSFDDFKGKHTIPANSKPVDLEATVETSFGILSEFVPEMGVNNDRAI